MKGIVSTFILLLCLVSLCLGTADQQTSEATDTTENLESIDESELTDEKPLLPSPSTSQDLKDYVDAAAKWAQKQEKSVALLEFNNKTGHFVIGDIYVYALDYSGIALALPFQPEMVGENFTPIVDASGKPFTKVEIALVKQGGGYILYHYPYPADDQQSTMKISFVRPVDDTYWIGAGMYTDEESILRPGLKQFVDHAKEFALENGKETALDSFNDVNGSFIQDDLYIFAYDYNGTVLAWPYRLDQIGVNRMNATDIVGLSHVKAFLDTAQSGGGITDYYSVNPFTNLTDLKISYVQDIDGTWMIGAGEYIGPGELVLRKL